MIKELFEMGYLNMEKIILSEAKNLDISPLETVVLIEIMNSYKRNRRIDKSVIMINLRLTVHEIDEILNNLLEKSLYEIYISYEGNKGEEYVSLDNLFKKIESSIITPSILRIDSEIEEVIQLLQIKMNKILSANELEYVKEWVFQSGYTKNRMVDVIHRIELANKKVTFRNLMVAITNDGGRTSGGVVSELISRMGR